MKTIIGDKEVFLSTVLVLPDHVQARLVIPVEGWNMKLAVVFKPDAEGGQGAEGAKGPNYQFIPDGEGGLKMTFNGWTELGAAMLQPVKIGSLSDGRAIGFQMFHFRAGNVNRADIQILFGGVYA